MQRISVDIENKFSKIIEPTGIQLVHWVIDSIGTSDIFNNENTIIKTVKTNTQHGNRNNLNNSAALKTDQFMATITSRLNPYEGLLDNLKGDEDRVLNTPSSSISNRIPFYVDHSTYTSMIEWGEKCTMDINCRCLVTDVNVAHDIVQRLNLLSMNSSRMFEVQLNFNYELPQHILTLLFHLSKLKNKQETFKQDLITNSGNNINIVKNPHNPDNIQVCVNHTLSKAIGKFSTGVETPDADGQEASTDWYAIEFSLQVQFSVPSTIFCEYPIVVDNKQVDTAFNYDNAESPLELLSTRVDGINVETECARVLRTTPLPFSIPHYDLWRVPPESPLPQNDYKTVMSVAFLITDTEAGADFDLTQPWTLDPDIKLKQHVVDRIRELGRNVLFYGHDYQISIYSNNVPLDPEYITFDEDTLKLHVNKLYVNGFTHRFVLSYREHTNVITSPFWQFYFDIHTHKS